MEKVLLMDHEGKLVEESRRGSQAAFMKLLLLHQARVRTYLARFVRDRSVIDDLAQETFLAAYVRLSTYVGKVPLALWLLGIARNEALKHLRTEERRRHREGRLAHSRLAGWLAGFVESHSSVDTDHDARISALEDCVRELPKEGASLVKGFYLDRRSAAEVARRLGRPESTIRVALLRLRRALRDCVEHRLAAKAVTP